MKLIEINRNPSTRELRQFAWLAAPAACLIVAALVWRRYDARVTAVGFLAVGAAIALLAAIRPASIRPLYVAWMTVCYPIGLVMSYVVVAVTFYLAITPIGLVARLFRRDPLGKKFDKQATTYWIEHGPPREASDYFRQF